MWKNLLKKETITRKKEICQPTKKRKPLNTIKRVKQKKKNLEAYGNDSYHTHHMYLSSTFKNYVYIHYFHLQRLI